jgi:tetrahydromethanopterin S-methyltransferase subunit D
MLKFVVYLMAGITLAGICVVAALTMGYDTMQPILIAAAVGAIVALPVSWIVAGRITDAG